MLGCGDLPFDYLEYLVSRLDVPLLYVPGNHDPSLEGARHDVDASALRASVAARTAGLREHRRPGCGGGWPAGSRGLGGSLRYKAGPNQYSQPQMGWRALKLKLKARLRSVRNGRKLDVLVTHAPPFGLAEAVDSAHVGFAAFTRLIRSFQPLLAVHGHIHPYGRQIPERGSSRRALSTWSPHALIEI